MSVAAVLVDVFGDGGVFLVVFHLVANLLGKMGDVVVSRHKKDRAGHGPDMGRTRNRGGRTREGQGRTRNGQGRTQYGSDMDCTGTSL